MVYGAEWAVEEQARPPAALTAHGVEGLGRSASSGGGTGGGRGRAVRGGARRARERLEGGGEGLDPQSSRSLPPAPVG